MSNSRFSCLAPPTNSDPSGNAYKAPGRHNRFSSNDNKKMNSRWNRSKSPEKNSRFPSIEKSNNFKVSNNSAFTFSSEEQKEAFMKRRDVKKER